MSLPHDIGGSTEFGPIDVEEKEVQFHSEFEGRMWAISRTAGSPDWTIDWWRHVRENIPAKQYYERNYFDSWMQTYSAAHIDSGTFSVAELVAGKSDEKVENNTAKLTYQEALEQHKTMARDFSAVSEIEAQFSVGDRVTTRTDLTTGHTRLPAYARGRSGLIHAYRGCHFYPDDSAKGIKRGVHLYTVEFNATEIWGVDANVRDKVYLDLWEAYFV